MDQSSEIIQLNIGGTPYTTTFRTLCREANSIFPQILSLETSLDRFESSISRLSDGTIFIDRDGDIFIYILDYLRTGKLILPDNFKETARFREEVLFYQLADLHKLLTPYYNLKYPTKPLNNGIGSFALGETGKCLA